MSFHGLLAHFSSLLSTPPWSRGAIVDPFTDGRLSWLLPGLGDDEAGCQKHPRVGLCVDVRVPLLWMQSQGAERLDPMRRVRLIFSEPPSHLPGFDGGGTIFAFPPAKNGTSCRSTAWPAFGVVRDHSAAILTDAPDPLQKGSTNRGRGILSRREHLGDLIAQSSVT